MSQEIPSGSTKISTTALIGPGHTHATITDKISSIVLTDRSPRFWWIGFALSFTVNAGVTLLGQLRGRSPIAMAKKEGHTKVVELLRKAGAKE